MTHTASESLDIIQTAEFLRNHDDYLILTHIRPDGDTTGCAGGLCHCLRAMGKRAYLLHNPEMPEVFQPYVQGLDAPEAFHPQTTVSVDIASTTLFLPSAQPYLERGISLAIDHHTSHEFFARHTCLDASQASCGQVVYQIVRQLVPLSPAIAAPLYVAVSTDCGCFVYGNTSAETHRIAADLMETGIPTAQINHRLFRTKSLRRLRLESHVIQALEISPDGTMGLMPISLKLLEQFQASPEDAGELASLIGQIEGIKVGITLRELSPHQCKISLRTDPTYLNATQVCALLGGGGHPAAAGATVEGTLSQVKEKVLQAVAQIQTGAGG